MKYNILKWKDKLKIIEPYFFYLILLMNLIPVLTFKFFPTVDGPAHLYNAKLMVEILKDPNSILTDFFYFNNRISPNWTGHFILSFFILIFPAFVAEKIVLLIYLIGFPISIRYLFNSLSIENKYLLYLLFPFTYMTLFYYGFYNFNIGLVLFFWGLALWVQYLKNPTLKKLLILALMSTLICLSHLFVFAMFCMVVFMLNISHFFSKKLYDKTKIKDISKLLLFQGFALSIGLIISGLYFINSPIQDYQSIYIPFYDILNQLKNISPVKAINHGQANTFSKWIFYIIVAFLVYFLSSKIYASIKKKEYKLKNPIWLIITLVTLILVFVIPNSKGQAIGFNTSRLYIFFFMFLIIWMASQKVNTWFRVIIFSIITFININYIQHNRRSISDNCLLAKEIIIASKQIEPNSIILPLTLSDNFIFGHVSNYLGVNKPMIILENYEATLDHFPLRWNCEKMPGFLLGDMKIGTYCTEKEPTNNKEKSIDYVFVLNEDQHNYDVTRSPEINNNLNSHYELLFEGKDGKIKIFKLVNP